VAVLLAFVVVAPAKSKVWIAARLWQAEKLRVRLRRSIRAFTSRDRSCRMSAGINRINHAPILMELVARVAGDQSASLVSPDRGLKQFRQLRRPDCP
jgi:hypothetical protein